MPTGKLVTIDPTAHDIADRIDEVAQAPTVALFVDVEGLKRVFNVGHQSSFIGKLVELAQSMGRLSQIHIFDRDKIPVERKSWTYFGSTIHTIHKGSSKDVLLTMQVLKSLHSDAISLFIFVVSDGHYVELVKMLAENGRMVAVVAPKRSNLGFMKSYCHFECSIESVIDVTEDEVPDDTGEYDFTEFVKLLASNEQHLPFVGVKYFIERQMDRLGIRDVRLRRKILQEAKDRELISFGSHDNIDDRAKPVTTCRLNMDNTFVNTVLQECAGDQDEDLVQ